MVHNKHGRRRYLQYAVLVGAAGLAGCLGDDQPGDDGTDGGADDGTDDGADGDRQPADDEADTHDPDDDLETTVEEDDDSRVGSEEDNYVIAGPDGAWRFDPEDLTVSVGDTVTWYFDSPSHNVTSHPDAASETENPDGAEPFMSYDSDNHLMVNEQGTEFEHTFEVPGEYVYVCTPHVPAMTGTVVVEE